MSQAIGCAAAHWYAGCFLQLQLREFLMRGLGAAGAAGLAAGGCAYAAMWPGSALRRGADCSAAARRAGAHLRRWAQSCLDAQAAGTAGRVRCEGDLFSWSAAARRPSLSWCGAWWPGHLIGNHSWSHPNLALTVAATVRQELTKTKDTLEQISGAPVRFFRPPFGARRPVVFHIARSLG